MMHDLISIIVPVYNTSLYLDECIQSVLSQDYTNIELILVDDGSTDDSGGICDSYAQRDSRIQVYHQKNNGQSSARNLALKHCNGTYYMFLDSDDCFCQNVISKLYNLIKKNNADLVYGGIELFNSKTTQRVYMSPRIQVENSFQTCHKMFIHDGLDSNTFAKLYKKELWNDVTFPENQIYEDVPIMYRLILKCNRVVQSDICIYRQRSRPGSTTCSEFNIRKMVYTDFTQNVYRDIKQNFSVLEKSAKIYYLFSVVDNFINLSISNCMSDFFDYWKDLKKIILENFFVIFSHKIFRKRKVKILVCLIGLGNKTYRLKKFFRNIRK